MQLCYQVYLVGPYLEVNPRDNLQGLGFTGLPVVHEETHPCASNFIQSIFETVQAGCINSVLVQTVPSGFEKKYFLIYVLNLGLQIFLLWPRKPLSLPSSVNEILMSIQADSAFHLFRVDK